jgi:hypothetical protein
MTTMTFDITYTIKATKEVATTEFEVHDSPGKPGHCYVIHDYLGCSRDYEGTFEEAQKCFLLEHGRTFITAKLLHSSEI